MSTFAESGFLDAVGTYLATPAGTAKVGVAEPVDGAELPAVVLSLDSVRRLGNGLGERSTLVTDGELEWTARIEVANPVVPTNDPKTLILPHGGLLDKPVTVKVNNDPRTPAVDRETGVLHFTDDLLPTDVVEVTYFLGQWERRVTQIAGVLRVDVRAAAIDDVTVVSGAVFGALAEAAPPAIAGLRRMSLTSLTSVGLPDPQRAGSRGRTALYAFDYEHEVNRPDSSGGVIRQVDVNAVLQTALNKE